MEMIPNPARVVNLVNNMNWVVNMLYGVGINLLPFDLRFFVRDVP